MAETKRGVKVSVAGGRRSPSCSPCCTERKDSRTMPSGCWGKKAHAPVVPHLPVSAIPDVVKPGLTAFEQVRSGTSEERIVTTAACTAISQGLDPYANSYEDQICADLPDEARSLPVVSGYVTRCPTAW